MSGKYAEKVVSAVSNTVKFEYPENIDVLHFMKNFKPLVTGDSSVTAKGLINGSIPVHAEVKKDGKTVTINGAGEWSYTIENEAINRTADGKIGFNLAPKSTKDVLDENFVRNKLKEACQEVGKQKLLILTLLKEKTTK